VCYERGVVRALVIAVVLLASGPAAAVEPVAPVPPVSAEPQVQPLGPDGRPVAIGQRRGKGSGFWGSDTPAPPGRPYRWEHMAIGLGLAACMGGLILYLIRKHSRRASA
jgi:hypothetical protein